jgi:hypothetical protein
VYTVLVNLQSADSHVLEVSKRSEAVPLHFKPTSNMLAAGAKAGRRNARHRLADLPSDAQRCSDRFCNLTSRLGE